MTDNHHTRQSEREAEMPLALILADNLEKQVLIGEAKYYLDGDAADELRRLHTQHQADQERIKELTGLLREMSAFMKDKGNLTIHKMLEAAIAKATGERND